ncbi:SURF1 family protein [Acidimicrobiia bacterium]|nr:SURF1 family protein [Acidimicrobiia bacterium]
MLSRLNNLPNKYLFYFGFIFVLLFLSLSYWQFTSYLEERELSAQISYPQKPTEVLISQINTSNEFTLITTQDKLQFVKSWLLRSRVNNGVSGYHVVTVFINEANEHILINRGWVPLIADVDNYNLDTEKSFTGMLYTYDEIPRFGQDDIPGSEYIFRIDKTFLQNETEVILPNYYLQLSQNCGSEITCINTLEQYQAPHLGYAFQWIFFAICLAVVVLRKNKLI